MNARYTAADLEFAAFLASRERWKVSKERWRDTIAETLKKEYDRVTDYNLTFLRGQIAAEETAHYRKAS